MSRDRDPLHMPDAYFRAMYTRNPDPWGFDSRWYEARKYALTLAALPRETYGRVFEPGCANGALTEKLAPRCEVLLAAEMMPDVAARARTRLAPFPQVEVRELAIPEGWPEGAFDLVVLSEVAYYLTDAGLADVLRRLDASLAPAGQVIAVHWTGATSYPLGGKEVHGALGAHPGLVTRAEYSEREFVLAVYERSAS